MGRRSRGRMPRGVAAFAAALVLAVASGAGVGALWQPRAAQAETIRELSWYLDAMHVEAAHRISRGNGVVVAVVDSGVDSSHPDLQGRVLRGGEVGEDPDQEVSGDGREDEDGHGTGMASLIAGTGKGANSILGVAPEAKILPVRLEQNSEGSFRPEYVYRGVRWAIDHGAKIVNMSLGGGRSSDAPWKKELIDYAIKKDVVLIAAAGNVDQGDTQVAEPASIPGVVAVSGVTKNGEFWDGSAKGPEVVVSAPAEKLPAAAPLGLEDSTGYVLADGTSGATALVSGVAALIRSAYPEASASDVVNRLIRTSEDRGTAGRDSQYGYGVVDARTALEGAVPKVGHHPLVSPEAAKSDEAAAARAERSRTRSGALIVVGVFLGGVILLLVGGYLVMLARRSRQVVVAGLTPGGEPVAMPVGALWGQRAGPGWPGAPPGMSPLPGPLRPGPYPPGQPLAYPPAGLQPGSLQPGPGPAYGGSSGHPGWPAPATGQPAPWAPSPPTGQPGAPGRPWPAGQSVPTGQPMATGQSVPTATPGHAAPVPPPAAPGPVPGPRGHSPGTPPPAGPPPAWGAPPAGPAGWPPDAARATYQPAGTPGEQSAAATQQMPIVGATEPPPSGPQPQPPPGPPAQPPWRP